MRISVDVSAPDFESANFDAPHLEFIQARGAALFIAYTSCNFNFGFRCR